VDHDIDVNFEPLPGYRLLERLGAGGYGEVWRAEAPGGLTKAIKFVFGKQHEKRATNELRALDHVRAVRHPFLLSLERIEVVDGRLLVVTELADHSVKDRFDICRREGHRGIPRDELLGYLRDTADALDFMSESHALQHLDIKPENLLILAGHVKVADFGLVKDVRQSQASLVGGMTPLYAAPEVFRGTPSRFSDQYSLAIVYQEMLTGTIPFAGSNAAELTLQHLNDEPDLSALSLSDRYAVSRALSKDPQHRYSTCRDFVEALLKATTPTCQEQSEHHESAFNAPTPFADEQRQPAAKTEFLDDDESSPWDSAPQLLAELPASDFRITDLPPVDMSGRDHQLTPTLVLGIGGTAGRVLSKLRRKIHEQYCGKAVPALQFLLIDTDSRALASAAQGESAGLSPDDTLNLPIRRPQHYRENSQQLLHWLSRRWLYNIPRSLRTEGLRPLGRLALTDHARQAGQRIRRAMSQAIDPQTTSQSSVTTGQQFRSGALRVFVVASISGGTGSGMALDIGYAVKAILQKLGVAESRVIGIMMHSTDRDARHSELARVNAYSWLSEFNHFRQHDKPYPGDVSCGLPAHGSGITPFDQTYLLNLGDGLDPTEFEQATQTVAEYLQLDTLTCAGAFFDTCRETGNSTLRSFGISCRTPASTEFCDGFASVISQQVLSSWVGRIRSVRRGPENSVDQTKVESNDPEFVQIIRRLQLETAGITVNSRALVEHKLGTDPATFLSNWLIQSGQTGAEPAIQLRAIEQIFCCDRQGVVEGANSVAGESVSSIVEPLAEKLRSELRRWIERRLNSPQHRLTGANNALQMLGDRLAEIGSELQHRRSTLHSMIGQATASVARPEPQNSKSAARPSATSTATPFAFLELCLDQVAVSAGESVVSHLQSEVKALFDEITTLAREIDQIAAAVGRAKNVGGGVDGSNCRTEAESKLAAELSAEMSGIARQVDEKLQADFLDPIGLAKTIVQGGRQRAQLMAKLYELSLQAVRQALAGIDMLQSDASNPNGSANDELKSALALATPASLEFGGNRRVLAVLPGEAADPNAQVEVSQRLGMPVTSIAGTDGALTLCVEADGLSLPHIALEIVERRRDRVEFAGRVHCRTDITWTPLIAETTPTDSSVWSAPDARATEAQNAMSKTMVL
jgi:serine/threonine protein kinase